VFECSIRVFFEAQSGGFVGGCCFVCCFFGWCDVGGSLGCLLSDCVRVFGFRI
jgi:hypothetical protein